MINNTPGLTAKIAEIEAFTQAVQKSKSTITNGAGSALNQGSSIITIPVVVHIIYNSPAENISDQQVQSQIEVLNNDYTRQNADTNNTPLVFRPYAANCGFQFALAKVDTLGFATTGIVRKQTGIVAFNINDDIKFSSTGGDDGWDKDRYLNIWVGNLTSGILGYSSVVGGPKENDGVVVLYSAFGAGGSAVSPFNKGRTTTHEIGHWLNLIHTWGDAQCGDDHVADTPPQETADYGCPNGVYISCNNAPNGDMYTNYMDFTNDDCMNIFTNGQNARMQPLFEPGGERFAILSSTALTAVPLESPANATANPGSGQQLSVYPNPATSMVSVEFAREVDMGTPLEIYNQVGQKVLSVIVNQEVTQLNVSSLAKGVYFIKITGGKNRMVAKLIKM
jgi:hypothetical protein